MPMFRPGRVLNVKVTYLIDSENVGDFWIPLLDLPAEETELVVFYTRNSPHMSYESLIRLKESDRHVTFIKCYEGTNALDFQLVSEMGYRIALRNSDSYVIVTNDTGYDAAVKYWKHKKCAVKRITGKECRYIDRRARERDEEERPAEQDRAAQTSAEEKQQTPAETAPVQKAAPAPADREIPAAEEAVTEPAAETETAEETVQTPVQEEAPEEAQEEQDQPAEETSSETARDAEPEAAEEAEAVEAEAEEPAAEEVQKKGLSDKDLLEIEMIVSCIGPENLAEIHNQLALFFGERGKEIYQGLKNGEITVNPQKGETVEKYQVYGQLIFARAEEEYPRDLPQFLLDSSDKMKNLNSLRYALLKHYGKDKGHRYYYLLKPFVKVLNQM